MGLILAATAALASCENDDDAGPAPTPTASATADSEAVTRRAVLDVYNKWSEASVTATVNADADDPALARYAGEPLLSQTRTDLRDLHAAGVILRGRPTWTVRITSLRLDAAPPTAALEVCLDTTTSDPVDKNTGKSVEAPGQIQRFKSLATATETGGRWLIVKDDPQRTTPC